MMSGETDSARARAVSSGPRGLVLAGRSRPHTGSARAGARDGVSRGIALGAAATATLGLIIAAVVIGLNSPIVDKPAVFVTLRTVCCGGLLEIALIMVARGASGRMPALLLATASGLALAGLTAADSPLAFAVGRISVTPALLLVIYVCFAYPAGRIEDRLISRLFAALATAMGVLLAANMLASNVPPVAGPFVRCTGRACPANPLNVIALGSGPSRALSTGLALVTALSLAITAVMVARRAARASPVQRRGLAPLLSWAAVAAVGYGFFVAVRAMDQHAPLLGPAAVVVAAIIAALPFALAVGTERGHVFAMVAVEHLIADLQAESSVEGLQSMMARTFGDPQVQLLLWHPVDAQYVDVRGRVFDVSEIGRRRRVAEISRSGERLAAVVHDPVLPDDVIDAIGSAIRLALDNAKLQMTLSASIRALESSRKRVARAADEERRRIEQDLHDGAQQGLIALRIRLQMLEEVAATDPEAVVPALADAGRRVQVALDEIRDLAHGIYPSALHDLGLDYALADVARSLPVQIVVRGQLRRRFPSEIETAVYFCCVEALQNIAKHCSADTRAELLLFERADGLHFVVSDTGPGFDPGSVAGSRGITGMRDRLELIGGRLSVRSAVGRGSTVSAQVPARLLTTPAALNGARGE